MGVPRMGLVLLVAISIGCATTHPPYDYASEPDPRKGDYVLGSSDVLKITVWRNPELSMVVPVRPDGKITAPLVDDMSAQGKTPSALARDMEKALAKYTVFTSACRGTGRYGIG